MLALPKALLVIEFGVRVVGGLVRKFKAAPLPKYHCVASCCDFTSKEKIVRRKIIESMYDLFFIMVILAIQRHLPVVFFIFSVNSTHVDLVNVHILLTVVPVKSSVPSI